jgi:ribosomal protein S18 acetylase RimI-like enzyme
MTEQVDVQDLFAVNHDPRDIVATIHAAFEEYRGVLKPESGALGETVESITAKAENGVILGIVKDQHVAACVCATVKDGLLYLDRLAVHPRQRRRGYAEVLVQAVETEAARQDLRGVSLGVRLALRKNIALFERLGFREIGRSTHDGYDAPTSMDMLKWL